MMQSVTLSSNPTLDLVGTQAGAQFLASRIIDVWAAEGHSIEAWVIKSPNPPDRDGHGNPSSWVVRTDLVNGMPSGLGRAAWERKFGRGI